MTLRITLESMNEEQTALRLEGRFTSADLPVLESCLEQLGAIELMLDLTELRWLDPPAVTRLSELIGEGARVVASSPFVEQLLARGEVGAPPEGRSPALGAESRLRSKSSA